MSVCTACSHDNHPQYSFCLRCAAELPLDPRREPIYTPPVYVPVDAPALPEQRDEPELPADLTGLVINDRYRLDEELGRDASSVFHRATHLKIDGAKLVVRLLLDPDRSAAGAFLTEARRLARLRAMTISICDVVTLPELGRRVAMVFHTSEDTPLADLRAFIDSYR